MARAPGPTNNPQFCRHFQKRQCTGCTRLHEPYERQLRARQEFVLRCLKDCAGGRDPGEWLRPITPSPSAMAYRTSVKLCLHEDRAGRRTVGLYRQGSRQVTSNAGCPAQVPSVNRLIEKLFARGVRLPARFYDHQGWVFQRKRLKFLTIRSGQDGAGHIEHALIISHTGVERADLIAWLRSAGLESVCAYESRLTRGDGDSLVGKYTDHLAGPATFRYALAGRTFSLAPAAFFQANHSLASGLISAATSFADQGDILLDLYGGFGAYSFAVADSFREVIVVDGNSAAIDAACRMAAESGTGHVTARAEMCEKFLEEILTPGQRGRVSHVIVNPPRGGLSAKVAGVLNRERLPALKELHYISCNPETLARDMRLLLAQGAVLRDVQPFDMFPQTDHIEVVARFGFPAGHDLVRAR